MDLTARRRAFRELHERGCFVMPNPWDVGSARVLAGLGFKALATTSAGSAWSMGRPDNGLRVDQALAHLTAMANAVDLPFNADFEGGFAIEPAAVAANVTRAIGTGISGLSIEDSTGNLTDPLFEFSLSVERIRAARRAIDDSGTGVVLTARSEGFIVGRPDLAETIKRLTAYADAGVECLFAPGIRSMSDIAAVIKAVAPKPVNVVVSTPFATLAQLADVGVRRISVGGALARVAYTGFLEAAQAIASSGSFEGLGRGRSHPEINGLFQN